KKVSKLAVVRNKIKRRIREAARYALPVVGKIRHDYLFFAKIEAYSCSWKELCVTVERAMGDPKCYKKEDGRGDSHFDVGRKKDYKGPDKTGEKTHRK
ncbi:962_t:CDS:2, partial [Acaulospora morrowiae]